MSRSVWLLCGAAALVAVGCGQAEEDYAAKVRGCASLLGSRASVLEPLRRQVEQIEAVEGLPLQLAQRYGANASFPTLLLRDQQRLTLGQELDGLTPGDRFVFDFEGLTAVQAWLAGHKLLIDRVATATERLNAAPAPQFELGFFDRFAALDDAAIACRTLLLRAAVRLGSDNTVGACTDVINALGWTDALAQAPRIEARALAGLLRAEVLLAAEQITWASDCTLADVERLYGAVRKSLDDEVELRDALVGERAVVMHGYEAVRAGLLGKLVTDEEKAGFAARGVLAAWSGRPAAEMDADELAYLEAMGWVIEQSSQPIAGWRVPLVDQLERLPEGTLARELFFRDMPDALQMVFDDRARREAAALGLATAGGLQLPPYRKNPSSGALYEARRQQDRVQIFCGAARLHDPVFRMIER